VAVVGSGGALRTVWKDAVPAAVLTLTIGLASGLVIGLAVVHVLALLGMPVETGTGVLLHRVLGG
jgi:hypothetical protein